MEYIFVVHVHLHNPTTLCGHARMGFSVDINTCDLLRLKASILIFGCDVVYIWSVRVNVDECETTGCAWLVPILVWSCSSLHSLLVHSQGRLRSRERLVTGPSIPGSWLHYFFNCCISCCMINNGRHWNVRMFPFERLMAYFWLICFPHSLAAFIL